MAFVKKMQTDLDDAKIQSQSNRFRSVEETIMIPDSRARCISDSRCDAIQAAVERGRRGPLLLTSG